jgi:uncharacterized protein HemX
LTHKDGYVSEATPDDTRPGLDAPQPPSLTKPPAKPPIDGQGRRTPVLVLALLLAVVALLLGGWSVWQLSDLQAREGQQLAQLAAAREQTQSLSERAQQLSARLDALPSAQELAERRRLLANLQGDQQQLNLRLKKLLDANRQDWRLAEAEHLLRLASLRLSALQDVKSARALVQGAEYILREQDAPGAFAAREQLANSLQALRDVQQPDRTGLFLQLGALREQVSQLSALTPTFIADAPASQDGAAPAATDSRWARWWQQISSFVRIDFNAEQNIRPLLAGQSLQQVRLALSLALEQAQWAVLNGQSEVYQQALAQARTVLAEHFEQDSASSRALDERLAELAKQPVAIATPNLDAALSAVQAYVQRRHAAAEAAAPAASESPAPETPESSAAPVPTANDVTSPSEPSKAPDSPETSSETPEAAETSDAAVSPAVGEDGSGGADGEGDRP